MTIWLSRSRMNERITRGENWLLASCRLTTVRETTTPAVVIVAPATVLSSHVAALLVISSVNRTAPPGPAARSTRAQTSARAIPASTTSVRASTPRSDPSILACVHVVPVPSVCSFVAENRQPA
jgi:hypothetical protein